MKIITLSLIILLSQSAFSQVTAGDGTINGIPISWNIDIYSYLEKSGSFPDLKKSDVRYFEVTSQKIRFPEIKNDHTDYNSTDRTISVTSTGSKQISIKPSGQVAKPGDIVNMAYNQKLKIYIPATGQYVWIAPNKKEGVQILSITKDASETDLAKIQTMNSAKPTVGTTADPKSVTKPVKTQQ